MKPFATTLFLAFTIASTSLQAQRFLPLFDANATTIDQQVQGPNDKVRTMVNAQGLLWMFGNFNEVNGVEAPGVATWNGAAFIPPNTTGFPESVDLFRKAIATPLGIVLLLDAPESDEVWLFDGVEWSALLTGLDGRAYDCLYHEGLLHIVGDFTEANGMTFNRHAQWDGSDWSSPGGLPDDQIQAIIAYDDVLYIGGQFENIGSNPALYLAHWNGTDWVQTGAGLEDEAQSMAIWNNQLIVGGRFEGTADAAVAADRVISWDGSNFTALSNESLSAGPSVFVLNAGGVLTVSGGSIVAGPSSDSYFYNTSTQSWQNFFKYALSASVDYEGAPHLSFNLPTEPGTNAVWYYEPSSVLKWDVQTAGTGYVSNAILTGIFQPSLRMLSGTNYSPGLLTAPIDSVISGSPVGTVFSSSLWFGGLHDETLYMAANRFDVGSAEAGMYSGFGPASENFDADFIDRYLGVWTFTATDIQNHIDQAGTPGYSVPPSIASYPGNGRVEFGESAYLAPYQDTNDNGWYDPEAGDYPLIKGDQCSTWIVNDGAGLPGVVGPGCEVIFQAYSFNSTDPDLAHTLWVQADLRNRSDRDYTDFTIGMWADLDIGSPFDDYLGCNPEANYFYGYNGDAMDEASSSSQGYGTNLPAQAVLFADHTMGSFMYYNNSSGVTGEPNVPLEYYQYLNATWTNGQHVVFGGDGFNPATGADLENETNFMFPDFPWEEGEGVWNEVTSGNPPGDRRGVGAVEPFAFEAGTSVCLNLALVTAFDSLPSASVQSLDARIANIQSWWNEQGGDCSWPQNPLGIEEVLESTPFLVYPNPSRGWVTVKGLPISGAMVQVHDALGKVLFESQSQGSTHTLNLAGLNPGVYFITAPELGSSQRVLVVN